MARLVKVAGSARLHISRYGLPRPTGPRYFMQKLGLATAIERKECHGEAVEDGTSCLTSEILYRHCLFLPSVNFVERHSDAGIMSKEWQ